MTTIVVIDFDLMSAACSFSSDTLNSAIGAPSTEIISTVILIMVGLWQKRS